LPILCSYISHCPGFAFHHVCIQSYSIVLWWSTVHVHNSMMIAIMLPYKLQFSIYNAVDSVLVFLMALWCATFVCISIAGLKAHMWLVFLVVQLQSILPLFYISFVTLHWFCYQSRFRQKVIAKICGWIRGSMGLVITACSEETLPNRLINPAEYPWLH